MRHGRLSSILDAVGKTPMVRLRNLGKETPEVEIFLKLEFANPGGSVKDRAAKQMILDARADGRLRAGQTLIDSTSGNTGVAYAMFGAALGIPVTIVMPSNVSPARKNILAAFGAEVIFSDPLEGSDGAIRLCKSIVTQDPSRWFYPDQYANPSNPKAHYLGTGPEILEQVGDRITHFVAGVGTSGTLMGTTRRLREHGRKIRCIGMEPDDPFHGLEGLKHMASSIVPPIFDPSLPDEIVRVGTEEGWDMASRCAAEEGLHVGRSSGANVAAALRIARGLRDRGEGGCIVTVACDRGDRYFEPMQWEQRYVW